MSDQADQLRRSQRLQNLSPASLSSAHSPSVESASFCNTHATVTSFQTITHPHTPIVTDCAHCPSSSHPSIPVSLPHNRHPQYPPPTSLHFPPTLLSALIHCLSSSVVSKPSHNPSIPSHGSTTLSISSFPIPDLSNQHMTHHRSSQFISPRTASSFQFPQSFSQFQLHNQVIIT